MAALYGDESSDGASAMIANAAHALEKVSRVSDEMRALSGKLNDLMYTAQDIADELRDKKDDLTYSADELEQIEERLDTLHKLKRKYGGSVRDILAFLEKAKRQLDEVEFATDRIEQLQKSSRPAENAAGAGHGTDRSPQSGRAAACSVRYPPSSCSSICRRSASSASFLNRRRRKTAWTPSAS